MNKIKILLINPYDSPDYLYRSIMEGLHNFNCELYYTHPDRLAKNVLTDEEAIHISSEVDYIFVIWDKEKPSVRPIPKYYLLDRINKKEKVVYIDGSEYNWTAYPGKSNELLNPHMIDKCRWYFKRECLPEHEKQGVFSLPFSAIKSDFGNFNNKKNIDVLCAFGQTGSGLRQQSVDACEELKLDGYNIVNTRVEDFFNKINSSYITIDAHGGGECNARTFQIAANGSCLFAQKYTISMPKLVDGENYVSWENITELKEKVRYYLSNLDELKKITDNGIKNIYEFQTCEKRVEYLLSKIGVVNGKI